MSKCKMGQYETEFRNVSKLLNILLQHISKFNCFWFEIQSTNSEEVKLE